MDFYITLSSSPTQNLPINSPSYSKYNLEKTIELDGEYEVALVQSVFKDFYSPRLATLKIFPDSKSNDEFIFYFEAEDGESYESVVQKLNNDLWMKFRDYCYQKFDGSMNIKVTLEYENIPCLSLNKNTHELDIHLPKDWKFLLTDQNKNCIRYLDNDEKSGKLKFLNSHYFSPRHFYVLSNLINDQLTGDEPAQILSNFVFDKITSNLAIKEFQYPQYIKLSKNFISDFNLEYTQDLFTSSDLKGTIISTLHFKKTNGF